MPLDERVARLEGRMTEHAHTLDFFRDAMNRIDARFGQVDARFAQIDARFAQVDARFGQVDARFDRLEDKMSRQFVWIVGIQVTMLVAMVGGLIGIIGVLAGRG